MKFFTTTAALLLAATTTTSVSAETCVLTELAASLTSVITPASACQAATGYTILPPTALPTTAQIAAICSQCQSLISAAEGVTFPTCTLTIDGTDVAIDTLFSSIVGQCSGATGSTSGSSASDSSSTITTAPTTAVSSTQTPSSASSSGSTGEIDDIATPSPTTTTATPSTEATTAPSTTSSAPGMAQAVGTAVVAMAATAALLL